MTDRDDGDGHDDDGGRDGGNGRDDYDDRDGRPLALVVGDVIDDVVVEPLAPIAVGTDTPARIEPSAGGSGANQAAWLGAAGVPVRFAGRVGTRDVGRHRAALARFGVDAVLAADPDRPTGTIVILLDDTAERTMFTDRGANLGLRIEDLPDSLLDDVGVLHLSGYSFFDDHVRASVVDLLERARARHIPVSLDPGSVGFLRGVGPSTFLDWVGELDVLLPNLDEARLLSGVTDPAAAAERLLGHAAVVAVSCGARGAVVAARTGERLTVPAVEVAAVDSTGAGDAFTAGFLAARLAGRDLTAATHAAVAAGGEAVGRHGGRPPVPDRSAGGV